MGQTKKKKRAKQQYNPADEIPENLRNFIDSVSIKPDENPVAQKKPKKQKEIKEDPVSKLTNRKHQLTDLEIVELWSHFKVGFPEGKLSKPQIMEVVRRVFPRCDADIILRNIFRVFDQDQGSGKINPRDLMMAFTMAMSGTIDEKLHWTFRLYDVDGNGEIDVFEMEKMFVSLCSIVEGSENDQLKRNRKEQEKSVLAEKIRQEKEELLMMLERERELENMKYSVNAMSENFKQKIQKSKESRLSSLKRRTKAGKGSNDRKKRRDATEETRARVEAVTGIASLLTDPSRDFRKFDSRRRAQELFTALDEDSSGGISELEWTSGCKSDEAFVKILTDLSPEFIWGYTDE